MTTETALKNAIEGGYDFKIGAIIKEAWQKTKGFKASYWGAFLFNLVIGIIIAGIFITAMYIPAFISHVSLTTGTMDIVLKIVSLIVFFVIAIIALLIALPLFAGL